MAKNISNFSITYDPFRYLKQIELYYRCGKTAFSYKIVVGLLRVNCYRLITGAPNGLFLEKSIPGEFLAGWQIRE